MRRRVGAQGQGGRKGAATKASASVARRLMQADASVAEEDDDFTGAANQYGDNYYDSIVQGESFDDVLEWERGDAEPEVGVLLEPAPAAAASAPLDVLWL